MWRIGIDLGGTKIEAVGLDERGQETERVRVATPKGDYAATLEAICALVLRVASSVGPDNVQGVGIGIPGSISPRSGLMRNANSTWLNGRPFADDLKARLAYPLIIENDANCFALSEARDGAAAGCGSVFGVILGTGVGGGLVMGGRLVRGRNAIGGEWGHNPLPWPDDSERDPPTCFCGKRGCLETFLSGPALEQQYLDASGVHLAAKDIALKAAEGEAIARGVLARYATRLAKALATVINIVDPDVIVFGGGVSNIAGIREAARAELGNWVFTEFCATEFRHNKWGDSSGVRGAAELVGEAALGR